MRTILDESRAVTKNEASKGEVVTGELVLVVFMIHHLAEGTEI